VRILVTGATGFLGFHLCGKLLSSGHQVTAFHRRSARTEKLEQMSVRCVAGELADPEAVRRAVSGHEGAIHAAAHIRYWSRDAALHQEINAHATGALARACRLEGVARFLYVSSVAAIGIPDDPRFPADERFSFNLQNTGLTYHLSKRRGEEAVLKEVDQGLDAVIVNPASIFGPHGQVYRGGEMIRKVGGGKFVPYFTGGICAVHVEDVAGGLLAALERGASGNRYILGGENLSYREIARRSLEALGLARPLVPVPGFITGALAILMAPVGRIRNRMPRFTPAAHYSASRFQYYSSDKARGALGYAPRGFDAIIKECLAWDPPN
jgi:dihydroflavonol-4-reductase